MTIQSIIEALAACLCAQFEEDELCFCGILPGDSIVWDYVEGDMAWVRLVGVAAVDPNQEQQSVMPQASCSMVLVATLEVGVGRCAPPSGDDGEPPSQANQTAGATQQYDDMMAMLRAVECCAQNRDLVLGGYTPIGPEGNGLGGFWNLTYTAI